MVAHTVVWVGTSSWQDLLAAVLMVYAAIAVLVWLMDRRGEQ